MKKIVLFLIVGASICSCATPYKISTLKPTEASTRWQWGREFTSQMAGDTEVKIAYERNIANELMFTIEITNNSTQEILVAPESFYIEYFNTEGAVILEKSLAVDPEQKLIDLEIQKSRQAAYAQNNVISDIVEISIETVNEISSNSTSTADIDAASTRRALEQNEIKNDIVSLNEQRKYLEETLLRKTSMPRQSTIYGNIYFDRDINTSEYKITIPVDDKDFVFTFYQNLIQP